MSHIDVGKPAKTGKDKDIPHHLKPGYLKIFLHDALYLFIRKKTPVHRFQVKVVVQKGSCVITPHFWAKMTTVLKNLRVLVAEFDLRETTVFR